MASFSKHLNLIRQAYSPGKKAIDSRGLWLKYVARPISFPPSAFFVSLGFTANTITYLSYIIGFAGCCFLAMGGVSMIIGSVCFNLWYLLDCVDGNIARYANKTSKYGEFIDDLGGRFMSTIPFFATGIGTFFNIKEKPCVLARFLCEDLVVPPELFIVVGSFITIIILLDRVIRIDYNIKFGRQRKDKSQLTGAELQRSRMPFVYRVYWNSTHIGGVLLPLWVVCGVLNIYPEFLIAYFVIYCSVFIRTLVASIKMAAYTNSKL